ncbi:hypothetical protein FQA47_021822 [Oryzias melastigma]|uniref:Uncharacterized protein n=1 Tax=Oryzias melastigma TaxID=30732 RepID=A0A834L0T5_ORYME|nr:hypothetical protein FQA47_021822 [Oryzias melastigma]
MFLQVCHLKEFVTTCTGPEGLDQNCRFGDSISLKVLLCSFMKLQRDWRAAMIHLQTKAAPQQHTRRCS